MIVAAEWGVGQVLWSMIWFTLFFMWIWLVITVFADIFRSRDLGGLAKTLWCLFVIFLPYLGVFVYIIARGGKMQENAIRVAQERDAQMRAYIQDAAGPSGGAAAELERLANLKAQGVISEEEFAALKAKALA